MELTDLEPATVRCLSRNGISRLSELMGLSWSELTRLRGLGAQKIGDVRDVCREKGLVFRPEIEPLSIEFLESIQQRIDEVFPPEMFARTEWQAPLATRDVARQLEMIKARYHTLATQYREWELQMRSLT